MAKLKQENSPLTTLIAKGTVAGFASTMVANVVSFLTTMILTRALSPEDFGIISLAKSYLAVVSVVQLMGIPNSLVYFLPRYLSDKDKARVNGTILLSFAMVLSISVVAIFVPVLFSDVINALAGGGNIFALVLTLMLVYAAVMNLLLLIATIHRGFKNPLLAVLPSLLYSLLYLVLLAIAFALMPPSIYLAVYANIGAAVLVLLYAAYTLRATWLMGSLIKTLRLGVRIDWRLFLSYTTPVMLMSILSVGQANADKLLLGYFVSTVDVGLYYVAATISTLPKMIVQVLPSMLAPSFSEIFYRRDLQEVKIIYQNATRWVWLFGLPIILVILVGAGDLLAALFGHVYAKGVPVLLILTLSVWIGAGTGNTGLMLLMGGKKNVEFLNSLGSLVLSIGLNLWLIPIYKIVGAAVATTIAYGVIQVFKSILVYRFWHLQPFTRYYLKMFFAFGCGLLMGSLLSRFGYPWFGMGSSVAVFYGVIWQLGIKKDDMILIIKAYRRVRAWSK